MNGGDTVEDMKERTPFGDRLYAARTHAKLSQPQLAKAVGMSQSTLGELEWTGQGTSKATQIARTCGVRSEWLSEGQGPMLAQQALSEDVLAVAAQIDQLPATFRADMLSAIDNLLNMTRTATSQQNGLSGVPTQGNVNAVQSPSKRMKRG